MCEVEEDIAQELLENIINMEDVKHDIQVYFTDHVDDIDLIDCVTRLKITLRSMARKLW